jgi:hypothetical protein
MFPSLARWKVLQTYRLPPSFGERLAVVTIQYELRVEFRQGLFGRHARCVFALFEFLVLGYSRPRNSFHAPLFRPCCPAFASFYPSSTESRPIPRPEVDQIGWYCLKPFRARGTIFKRREVRADFTVSVSVTTSLAIPRKTCELKSPHIQLIELM